MVQQRLKLRVLEKQNQKSIRKVVTGRRTGEINLNISAEQKSKSSSKTNRIEVATLDKSTTENKRYHKTHNVKEERGLLPDSTKISIGYPK